MEDDDHTPAVGLPDAELTNAQEGSSRLRLQTTLVWIVVGLLLIGSLAGIFIRVKQSRSGSTLAASIADGSRPVAPTIVDRPLEGSGAPPLPAWFGTDAARGHVIVANMWASWCGPCREEAPLLRDVSDAWAERGVLVVGMNPQSEDAASDARDFVEEFDVPFPVVRFTRAEKDAWGISGYPETYVIGGDGRIGGQIRGPLDASTLEQLIEREVARAESGDGDSDGDEAT